MTKQQQYARFIAQRARLNAELRGIEDELHRILMQECPKQECQNDWDMAVFASCHDEPHAVAATTFRPTLETAMAAIRANLTDSEVVA
jgi:hypothetical protein